MPRRDDRLNPRSTEAGSLHSSIDDDSLTFALALKDNGVPFPDIAKKLTIKTGKNAGKSPSVASLCRALAEAERAAADDGLPIRPKPVRIRHPDDPLTPEEVDLRGRLQAQVLQHPQDEQPARSISAPTTVSLIPGADVPGWTTQQTPRGFSAAQPPHRWRFPLGARS